MRKIKIDKNNHFRAILTDTVPYEVPFFFTNEPLFIQVSNSPTLQGFPDFVARMLIQKDPTKPFTYRVQKTGGAHRKLAVPHPAAQLQFAELYRHFDSFIESVCSRSSYSLRHPTRVGSHFYQNQFLAESQPVDTVDADPAAFVTQRRWASSYFYYRQFTHVHKFFSSDAFVRLEQKYSLMLKLDISRCFESIYTHSIAWAIRGKDFGKQNKKGFFFESEFDKRMQNSNWGETSGILIGPEVSRVFAESIMQSVDVGIQRRLGDAADRISIKRYVDDFFVFSNSEEELLRVKAVIEEVASEFNLHINEKKTEIVRRPLVSHFSVARQRVAATLNDLFQSAKAAIEDGGQIFGRNAADKTIAEIRRIARENNADYSTLASPALAIIWRSMNMLRRRLGKEIGEKEKLYAERLNHCAIRVATFLFLMDIRAATSHKLAKILHECSLFNARIGAGRLAFEGAVLDSVRLGLDQARVRQITGPEVINLLVASDAVCEELKGVTEDAVCSAFGVDECWHKTAASLNYFELVSVLYFARKKYSFKTARSAVIDAIEKKVLASGSKLGSQAEETMLFFDFLSCPHIEEPRRLALFTAVAKTHGSTAGVATLTMQFKHVSRTLKFVAWEGAKHFQAMLERRELQSAYDS